MIQLTPCGLLTIDRHSNVVDVNATLLEWLACDRGEVVGRRLEALLTLRLPMSESGDERPTDATLHGTSGGVRPVVVGVLETSVDGSQQLAIYDVSARSAHNLGFRGAEAKTERGRKRLQILLNSAVGFGNVRTETGAADLLVDVAQRAFAASHVSVHLRDATGLGQAAGVNPLAEHWPPGFRPTGSTTLLGGKVIILRSPDDADAYVSEVAMSDIFRASGIQAAIASPMLAHGDPIGSMICFFDHPREFDEEAVPLAEALSNQAAQAIARIRLEETLRRAAMHDEVTGLPNRRLVEEDVARTFHSPATTLSVIFVDLDGFKAVNDRLGHAAGDALLREVGQRMRSVLRDTDVVGRFGGDEFIAVAAVDDDGDAQTVAERIRVAIAARFDDLPDDITITASIGVVIVANDGASVMDQLVRAADHAMYEAKMAGGDQVIVTEFESR